jgi:hypothetical protein
MPKQQKWFWLAAYIAAWFFDFLFWKKPSGVSFFIWTAVLLAAGYLLAWREGKRPSVLSVVLTILIAGFAAVLAWREEPLTRFVSILLTFGGMILLTATFLNGYWPWYRLRDYFVEFFKVIGGGFAGAVKLSSHPKDPPPLENSPRPSFWRRVLPVLRGVLIALPIVAVLGLLLSSADPVFGDWLKRILNLEKLPEYLFRLFYILIIGTFLVGVYLKALYPSGENARPEPNQPWFKPFLGWTETGIILGAVDALFIAFVVIQVRYLFGGTANISETGYTYSEYARRGFGELVAVAVLSLGLYLSLATAARRESKASRVGFTVMAVLLMANVLVILASSLQRLMLYESAYGFSQLRTYTHVFIYWLAGLILVTIVLELLRRRGNFALAMLICVVGFGASLALMNVDGLIADQNINRAVNGEQLDVAYLNSLSSDAVPTLIKRYQDPALPSSLKDDLGSVLACREKDTENPAAQPWQGYQFGQAQAYRLLHENSDLWKQYKPYLEAESWMIQVNGEEINCSYVGMLE